MALLLLRKWGRVKGVPASVSNVDLAFHCQSLATATGEPNLLPAFRFVNDWATLGRRPGDATGDNFW
jgi:hypothetical protein